ncbi:MAG TPA: SIMPL domain-containing protein [Patescibacteria group bacterium]|nr:SIMPL domain-containing protein [Patescibacteria group bacterium]
MKNYIATGIIAISVIVAAALLSNAWKKTHRTHQTVSVTGLAEENFVSDLIVWNGSFSQKSMSLQDAYAALKRDAEAIRNYLLSNGVSEKEIVFDPPSINKEYNYITNVNGSQTSVFNGYALFQNVKVESNNVDKIEDVSRKVAELINTGIELNSQPPQYYYTKLAELKIRMLAAASKDGRNRAEKIAENADSDIGDLKKSEQGIFQITGQNSGEDYSWGGAFNTTSKRKTASVTVKQEFELE